MSDYIPNHLLANVLLRLPFVSLLRSRCVSKSWRALIDCSDFIEMHLNKANQETNYPNGIKIIAISQNNFYTLDLDLDADGFSTSASAQQLSCPLGYSASEVRLVGSCNGLLCLMYPNRDKIVLWNPWIQKSWELPSSPVEYPMSGGAVSLLGFGHDGVNDDYKVLNRIRFTNLFDEGESNWYDEVYVYSLKLNTWTMIEDCPFKQSDFECYCAPDCILANGALHWLMKEWGWCGVCYIISFDLSSQEFQKMPCPKYPEDSIQRNLRVLNNGCLCVVAYYEQHGGHGADLWVMKEYGVDKSWVMKEYGVDKSLTKLTSVKMPDDWAFWRLTPLALSENRKQLLLQIEGEKLVLHDLETRSIIDLAIRGDASYLDSSCTCIGSLVRPYGTD